ncbi:hypothetical protein L6452_39004 [Arctium lappa]|uniref:Uncharacterized protein n=1 Tax=Arctium lappa TaxID=4217 RepID=A0ACB8XV79_ARCLA|nr:hypothetical protein L6452_39004 [Arctium lappa]
MAITHRDEFSSLTKFNNSFLLLPASFAPTGLYLELQSRHELEFRSVPAHTYIRRVPHKPVRNNAPLTPPFPSRLRRGGKKRRSRDNNQSFNSIIFIVGGLSISFQLYINLLQPLIFASFLFRKPSPIGCFSAQTIFPPFFLEVFLHLTTSLLRMDQFGVLVESIGFKAHGKSSAPLADLKGTNKINDNTNGLNKEFSSFTRSNYSNPPLDVDDLDGIFRSNSSSKDGMPPNSGFDDVFGGLGSGANGIDFDSVFKVSNNYAVDDDVFGLNKRTSGSSSGDHYQSINKTNPIDDLLGDFGGMGMASNGPRNNSGGKQANASKHDDLLGKPNGNGMKSNGLKKNSVQKQEAAPDLLSGFGIKIPSSSGRKSVTNPSRQSSGHSANSFSASAEDPFVMMERAYGSSKANGGASGVEDYLDSFFSPNNQSSTRPSQSSTTEDSVYDALFNNNGGPKAEKKVSSEGSYGIKKASAKANGGDDFSYLFGMGDAPSSGEFQEMKGESEERRRARLNHHMTTRERMAKALNEKTKRDLQAQREQDEKLRVAATLDGDIKRWAVGKEGNLRALLSSLQHVLWSGSGWQPISLTDLITSTAVKKAYYKATLCIHPDKVQQKGATVQQKYIAEKVFDLLKEAWNKFNAEEFKKQ